MSKLELPFDQWPAKDRDLWTATFTVGDRFDDSTGRGAHLAETSKSALTRSYSRFLSFLTHCHRPLVALPIEQRVNRKIIAKYVTWRRRRRPGIQLVVELQHFRGILGLMYPQSDWSWLATIAKSMAAIAPQRPAKQHITSERLYALGLKLMNAATSAAEREREVSTQCALDYRDGLIIALLALIPLRRRTMISLRIGRQLKNVEAAWLLDIPGVDVKTKMPLEFLLSSELSRRMDIYLRSFRPQIFGSAQHDGVFASCHGKSMSGNAAYAMVWRRTLREFGFGVNLHRFRHAAATLWSIHDPVNVHGVKDLLGQITFSTTEIYYIAARSRVAGRIVASLVNGIRDL